MNDEQNTPRRQPTVDVNVHARGSEPLTAKVTNYGDDVAGGPFATFEIGSVTYFVDTLADIEAVGLALIAKAAKA